MSTNLNAQNSTNENANSFHHGNLRQALLELALSELESCGYENLSLRKLAKQLGVSRSAPYRHFENREAILVELSKVWVEKMNDRYLEIIGLSLSAKERLKAACLSYLESAELRPELYRIVFVSSMYWQNKTIEDVKNAPELVLFRKIVYDVSADKSDNSVNEAVMLCGCALHGYVMLRMTGHVDFTIRNALIERVIMRIIL